jgi:hypothetical protein
VIQFLKNIAVKLLILVVAVQILNLGVDAIDFTPKMLSNAINEFNYINSMSEYISEVVAGNEDAFPEYQNNKANSSSQIIKHSTIKLVQPFTPNIKVKEVQVVAQSFAFSLNETYSYQFFTEIVPPPPKTVCA